MCINMSKATFKYYLKNFNLPWTCYFCSLPKFSDSFFEQPNDGSGSSIIIRRRLMEVLLETCASAPQMIMQNPPL